MIQTIGIVGSGQMGSGIAQVAAQAGYRVILHDIHEELAAKGKGNIEKNLERLVQKTKITEAQKKEITDRVRTTTDLSTMKEAQLVVEAVMENLDLKRQIFKTLDEKTPAGTILASNTSSISITTLGAATKRPGKVIGMHFMNPVPVMKLVEIVRGRATSDETHREVVATAQNLGKEPVTVRDSPGFVVNRILIPMINEAANALEDGISTPEDIDKAMKFGANHPMGPLELADLIGLDTVLSIMKILHEGFKDDRFRPAPILQKYVTEKRLGRKTGRGFFTYPK